MQVNIFFEIIQTLQIFELLQIARLFLKYINIQYSIYRCIHPYSCSSIVIRWDLELSVHLVTVF
jgi:hypothetical protein